MTERYVLQALQSAVVTAVGASPPVKYVNRNMNPPSDGKWWEVVYLPNNIEGEFWGNEKTFRGVIRLVLHWPQDDKGAYAMFDEAQRVADKFVKGSLLQDPDKKVTVKITETVNVGGIIEQPPENILALTVRYQYFNI